MSSKFMYSLSDENPDLQKQIGCMNGLFQLFDCHHFHGPNHKSLNSCSSSFSPAECSKESQVDRSSQTIFRETPRKEISSYLSNASLQSSQNSLDLRNVVKDSIYREACGISIKTAATKVEAGPLRTLTYIDSPRPLQSSKPSTTRNTSLNETSHARKFKEVPKMSNERSIHGSINCMKSNFLVGELNRTRMNSYDMRNRQHEPESYKGPSSVVAKLMGVEALLDPMLTKGNQSRQFKTGHDLKGDLLSPSLRLNETKRSLISGCSRNSGTEPRSPRMTNAESKKPVANRCSTEPAPWRQLDGNKGTGSPTCLKSPIKIIKPARVPENASNSTSTIVATSSRADTINEKDDKRSCKDVTPRTNPLWGPSARILSRDKKTASTQRLHHISKEQSPTARENPKMAMSSETTCLKRNQKKLEIEKQSRCDHPPSRSRRQSRSLQAKSGLPRWKARHQSHNLQQSDDKLRHISSDMRYLNHQRDDSSMRSESNMSMASYGDIEVTRAQSYDKIDDTPKHENKQKNPKAKFSEGTRKTEPPRTALEQPSPVSVLDAAFYGDESPSPVKKKSNAFEDWSYIGLNHLLTCRETSPRFMNLDSINEIEHICSSSNPDHEYIAEVMSASGILGELDFSFLAYQLHPSGHLINPSLFASLEQIKASIWFLNRKHKLDPIEKIHRQLIFDAVNEILILKSVKKGSYKQWILPSFPQGKRRKRLQMVRDLCSDIDKLQATSNIEDDNNLNSMLWRDLTVESTDWTECRREIPWLVLDVERLIFKDLICEVISSQATNVQQQQRRRHCRRLFSV